MLIATFGPSTGWAGKTITFDNNTFTLEGHGLINAADVMEYDRQGHLAWASEGTRAWVGSKAATSTTEEAVGSVGHAQTPSQHSRADRDKTDERTGGQQAASVLGLLLLICGLMAAVFFGAIFDVSVEVPYTGPSFGLPDRVNNVGLMADRQNGIIFGFAAAIAGGALMFVGRKRTRSQAPPIANPAAQVTPATKGACNICGGLMDVGAAYCPHCGQKLSWTAAAGPPTAAT